MQCIQCKSFHNILFPFHKRSPILLNTSSGPPLRWRCCLVVSCCVVKSGHTDMGADTHIDIHKSYYRPQTKFAKVMFSQLFACPRGVSVSVLGGDSVRGCPLSRGVSIQGRSLLGGLCPGGSLSRGSLSRRVCVQGGLCQGDSLDSNPPSPVQ